MPVERPTRAVVLGAGMAGLLAARVLSESFAEVIVVDRDEVLGVTGTRPGVPHGPHAHALLARGEQILSDLFPGLMDELVAEGVFIGDLASDLRWYFHGNQIASLPIGLKSVSSTRPVLERHVRRRVAARDSVHFLERTTFGVPVLDSKSRRVVGVRITPPGGEATTLAADFVVDASGRNSRLAHWLDEHGFDRPRMDRIKVDLAYTTRRFRLRSDPYCGQLSINSVASPENPRGAFFPKLEDGTSALSLTGLAGDYPPADLPSFLAFARSLAAPEIAEAICDAEPVGEPETFRFAASVRRHFEELERFPLGIVPIGDAICSFNPVYGQGMTVASMEAVALRDALHAAERPADLDARGYFRAVAPIIDVPWEISAGADLGFPQVEGHRSLKVRLGNLYMKRLQVRATDDPALTGAFFRVAGLLDPPTTLVRLSVLWRVLAPWRHRSTVNAAPRDNTTLATDKDSTGVTVEDQAA